jgi:hypothetical protein
MTGASRDDLEHQPEQALGDLLDELDRVIRVGRDVLVQTEFAASMAALRALGFDVVAVQSGNPRGVELLFRYMILGATELTPRLRMVRAEIRAELDPSGRELHDRVLAAPFSVWDVFKDPLANERVVIDAAGLGPGQAPIENVIRMTDRPLRYDGVKAAGVVGWLLQHQGLTFLLALDQLDTAGAAYHEAAAGEAGRSPETKTRDVLLALVDPRDEYGRGPIKPWAPDAITARGDAGGTLRSMARGVGRILVAQLHGAGDRAIVSPGRGHPVTRVRWFRERIATVVGPRDMNDLVDFVRRLRDARVSELLLRYERGQMVTAARCEALVPISELVGAFGLRPDGALADAHAGDDALRRRPASLLLLDDGHALWNDVHPAAPIGLALDWTKASPRSAEARAVAAAWGRLRAEERWLATFRPVAGNDFATDLAPRYEDLIHAFASVYDPAVLETPLGELDLGPRGGAKRLVAALTEAGAPVGDDGEHRVAALPAAEPALLRLKNYGGTTHRHLVESLHRLASEWRWQRAGLRAQPAQEPAAEPAAAEPPDGPTLLKQGLDELAALFDATPEE